MFSIKKVSRSAVTAALFLLTDRSERILDASNLLARPAGIGMNKNKNSLNRIFDLLTLSI